MALSIVLAMGHGMESFHGVKSVQKAMKKKKPGQSQLGFDMCFANLLQCVQRDIETKKTLLAFQRCFAALASLFSGFFLRESWGHRL